MAHFNLKNKVAVIIGGAGGIGLATAEEFLKKEVKTIILLDIAETGDNIAKELNSKYASQVVFMKCDVTRNADNISEEIFDKFKKVDILVNSAGIVKEDSVRKTMEVNAIAVMEFSLKFFEYMSKEKDGTIMNVSSVLGFRIDPMLPIYKASKFAIMGFSRTLGHEINYKKSGVRVIVLCPGVTTTNFGMVDNGIKDKEDREEFEKYIKAHIHQNPHEFGKAAVEVFERAKSGSAWLIEGGKFSEIL